MPCFRRSFPSTLVLLIGLMLVSSGSVGASVFKRGAHVDISKLDIIDDDLYANGQRLTIDGIVSGDVVAFTYQATIRGEVGSSANLFARNVEVTGKITGSLRSFSETMTLSGHVSQSALILGRDIILDKGSVVERDLTVRSTRVEVNGTVTGDVDIEADVIDITGVLTGNVKLTARTITIKAPAAIGGDLTYTCEKPITIDSSGGAVVAGQIKKLAPDAEEDEDKEGSALTTVILKVSSLFAAFLFGIIVVALFRPYAEESVTQLRARFSASVAAGLLGLAIVIVSLVVLLFAILTALAGLALISGDLAPVGSLVMVFSILMLPITSFAGVSGAVFFYSGKIVVGLVLGYLILVRAKPDTTVLSKSAMFLGLTLLTLLFFIPIVGTIVYLGSSIIGLGAILLGIRDCRRKHGLLNAGIAPPSNAV